nr:MAG TPA: Rubrerythrin [Caudoviricetes sp.]
MMRNIRQILSGCKKHKYRYIRRIRWYEDEYRSGMPSKWICTTCGQILNTEMKIYNGFLPN